MFKMNEKYLNAFENIAPNFVSKTGSNQSHAEESSASAGHQKSFAKTRRTSTSAEIGTNSEEQKTTSLWTSFARLGWLE